MCLSKNFSSWDGLCPVVVLKLTNRCIRLILFSIGCQEAKGIYMSTRMESSRISTGHLLTVFRSMLLPGACLVPGGVLSLRGVYLVPGAYLVTGGCVWFGGVPGHGGHVWYGGVWCWGGIPRQVLPPMNRMTDRCKNITLAKISFRPVKCCDGWPFTSTKLLLQDIVCSILLFHKDIETLDGITHCSIFFMGGDSYYLLEVNYVLMVGHSVRVACFLCGNINIHLLDGDTAGIGIKCYVILKTPSKLLKGFV